MDPQTIRQMARQVLDILIYLHEQSPPVVHRDIKPSNLIEGIDGSVNLIDFGAVQAGTVGGQTVTVVGTFGYMPPEQFGGRTVPASDLYALGITLVALLTGTSPGDWLEGKPPLDALRKNDLSLCRWLERLTETELTRRINSAREALVGLDDNTVIKKPLRKVVEVESPFALARLKIEQNDESLIVHMRASREGVDLLLPLAGALITIFGGPKVLEFALPIGASWLGYLIPGVAGFFVVIALPSAAWLWLAWKMIRLLFRIWNQTKSKTIVFSRNSCDLCDGFSGQWSKILSGRRVWNVQPLFGSQPGLRLRSLCSHGRTYVELHLPLYEAEVSPLAVYINRWLTEHPDD